MAIVYRVSSSKTDISLSNRCNVELSIFFNIESIISTRLFTKIRLFYDLVIVNNK
ncbi:Uncharacterised protein [Mycobacteroides abscessus subsp. abscessus]|nr:Uncharacterised protein [Mycobacteroides abscessus subsp. abscessus]